MAMRTCIEPQLLGQREVNFHRLWKGTLILSQGFSFHINKLKLIKCYQNYFHLVNSPSEKKNGIYNIYLPKCFHALVHIQAFLSLKDALSCIILTDSRQLAKKLHIKGN